METKLCRICGRMGANHLDIFKIEGLKHKIETCLPIFVTQHCLLPDTICPECLETIANFYRFIKNCLQSIIVLESQYDVTESCLRSKRKRDIGCAVDFPSKTVKNQDTQTEDRYDILFAKYKEENPTKLPFQGCDLNLVDYDVESEISETDNATQNQGVVIVKSQKNIDGFLDNLLTTKSAFAKQYFDNFENDLIGEIVQRKTVKRKAETIENLPTKICKFENVNRRKSKVPKKIDNFYVRGTGDGCQIQPDSEKGPEINLDEQNGNVPGLIFPQVCLLCEQQCAGPAALTAHIFEVHEVDFTQILDNSPDKKKKIPNLLKISDMKRSNSFDDNQQAEPKSPLNPRHHSIAMPTQTYEYACQICQYSGCSKQELYAHCRSEHPVELPLMCGICFQPTTTLANLKHHLKICAIEYPIVTRYFCAICKYGEDGMKGMENHVLVHDFLLDMCKKEVRMFDPADYVELNPSCEFGPLSPASKSLTCNLCFQSNYQSFKEFSDHRRKQHGKFHCDLCNKFYGRNSHLWKHVNRLHKNHPSLTCQMCYRTSASKYHLGQHFAKIHATKVKSTATTTSSFDFHKFQPWKLEKKSTSSEFDEISNNATSDQEISDEAFGSNVPKEIDASSDLYTNIITNYTPPPNEGEFKCPKCSKGFSKKLLLKKHKKNCRPKLQKDLLTRCKSCARIFKDRQSLAKHLVNYHSEYTCEICSQKTQSKCEIVSHIRFTHPNCMLFCKICGNILRSKQNLNDHMNDHINSYVCQFCGDTLPSKIKLKMHILSLHRKILSLSCGICLKLFENQHILRNHVQLVHKNELRPFTSCTVCGKNYGSKWKTYDHLNKSHGRIFKACKTCLEIFDSEQELELHFELIHKNQNAPGKNLQVKEEIDESESGKDELEDVEENDKEIFDSFASEMSGFSRMSLLEKRLLGKNIETKQPVKTKVLTKKQNENIKLEDDIATQQNTSKRTVYVNSDVPSLCEICFKTWPAKKHLWQHYIRCHKSVAATVCGICLKTNIDYRALQQHLRTNHPTLLHGQGFGSNFICRICGRYHNASSKLKLHMAIHENFDWSILETAKSEAKGTDDDDRYFESLIEQVECSTNDDDADASEKSSSDMAEESESETSENSAGGDKEFASNSNADGFQSEEESDESSSESCSTENDIEENSNTVSSNEPLITNGLTNSNSNELLGDSLPFADTGGMFRFKTEELDSAVKSISLECEEEIKEDLEIEYCELPMNSSLNEREIESAVGSIL